MTKFLSHEREQYKNKISAFALRRNLRYAFAMISVLIPTSNDEERLAHMLAGLVRAAVDGMVSEVIVLDSGSQDGTREVAEIAGCTFADLGKHDLRDILGSARADWLLALAPGTRLAEGWTDAVLAHVNSPAGMAGAARFKVVEADGRPFWKRMLFPPRLHGPLARGLLVSRRQALASLPNGAGPERIGHGLAVATLGAGVYATVS